MPEDYLDLKVKEEGEDENAGGEAQDPIPTSKKKVDYWKRCCCLEVIFRNVVVVCIVWTSVQSLLGFAAAISIVNFGGRILGSAADDEFNQELLSPVIPVWNDLGDSLYFGSILSSINLALCMVSLTWLIIAFLCGLVLWKKKNLKLWMPVLLGMVSLAVFFFQIILLTSGGAWNSMILRDAGEALSALIRDEYKIVTTDAFSTTLNILMVLGRCCGFYGPGDFAPRYNVTLDKNIYSEQPYYRIDSLPPWPTIPKSFVAQIPPACCHNDVVFQSPDRALERLVFCSTGKNNESYYHVGCSYAYQKLWDKNLRPGFTLYFSLSTCSLALLVVYCVIAVACMFLKPVETTEEEEVEHESALMVNEDEDYARKAMEEMEEEED